MFLFFLYEEKFLRCPGWHELAGRDEGCVASVYGQQIRHHLSGNREYCPIGITSPLLALIEQH
jgi:hypothetical protein